MSYDVTVGDDDFNYTYNLGRFFRAFEARPVDWDGRPADVVATKITRALHQITVFANLWPGLLDHYNPPNGWGSWQGAVKFLTDVMIACIENPDSTVEAS